MTSPVQSQELLPTCYLRLGPLSQPSQHQGSVRGESKLSSSSSRGHWQTCSHFPCQSSELLTICLFNSRAN